MVQTKHVIAIVLLAVISFVSIGVRETSAQAFVCPAGYTCVPTNSGGGSSGSGGSGSSTTTTAFSDARVTLNRNILELIYDNSRGESALKATYSFSVTAVTKDVYIYKNGAIGGFVNQGGTIVAVGPIVSTLVSDSFVRTLNDSAGRELYVINSGQTVRFTATIQANPKQMFAGTYRGVFQAMYANNSATYGASEFQLELPRNYTNSKTIVGEVSPYITTIDNSNTLTSGAIINLKGQRFNNSTLRLNGIDSSATLSISRDGTTARFTLPSHSDGRYYLSLYNPTTGESNRVYFNVGKGDVTQPSTIYPGFYLKLDKTQYSLNDQAYLTISRGDNSYAPYSIDVYAYKTDASSNVLLVSGLSVSQNTVYNINLRNTVFTTGGNGQYGILVCATGQDCRIGSSANVNRNSTLLTIGSGETTTSQPWINITYPTAIPATTVKPAVPLTVKWEQNYNSSSITISIYDSEGRHFYDGKFSGVVGKNVQTLHPEATNLRDGSYGIAVVDHNAPDVYGHPTSSGTMFTISSNGPIVPPPTTGYGETETFSKEFYIDDVSRSIKLYLAADNQYSVSINGSKVASSNGDWNFNTVYVYNITSYLRAGNNKLSITVFNNYSTGASQTGLGNPAGLIYKIAHENTLLVSDGAEVTSGGRAVVLSQNDPSWVKIDGAKWIWNKDYYAGTGEPTQRCEITARVAKTYSASDNSWGFYVVVDSKNKPANSNGWTANFQGYVPQITSYGVEKLYGNFFISSGPLQFTAKDQIDSNCSSSIMIYPPTLTPTPTTREQQVRQLYLDLLHRAADEQGLKYWVNTGWSVDQMKTSIMQGIEYQTKVKITEIFKQCGKGTPNELDYYKWYYIAENNGYNVDVVRQGLGCTTTTIKPSITISSPWSGGEKIAAGTNYTVRWSSTNIPVSNDMKVFIIGQNGYFSQVVGNGPNTGYLPITIPAQLNGDYEFMVQTSINGQIYSGSSYANILQPATPVPTTPTPVTPAPTASISVSPTIVTTDDSVKVTWSSTNAASCTGIGFSTYNQTSGSQTVRNIGNPGTVTYSVSCANSAGVSTKSSATLTVTSSTPVPVVSTPVPAPTANFTINGQKSYTYNVGETNNYVWSSTNADKFSSSYTSTGGSVCGGGSWVANTASGSSRSYISSAYAGCTWTVTYTATNSQTGQSASDTVVVKVNPLTTSTSSVWDAIKNIFSR